MSIRFPVYRTCWGIAGAGSLRPAIHQNTSDRLIKHSDLPSCGAGAEVQDEGVAGLVSPGTSFLDLPIATFVLWPHVPSLTLCFQISSFEGTSLVN